MGWTGYVAEYYKNGKIDRKKECDKYFIEGLNRGHFIVHKSAMIGSVYYAAVSSVQKPERVFAVVFLTSVKDGYFYYKDMDESEGPRENKCPKSILTLLSEPNGELSESWRKRCWEYHNNSSKDLGKLPIGTKIKIILNGNEVILVKHPPAYQFKTWFWYCPTDNIYYKKKLINSLNNYEVIK